MPVSSNPSFQPLLLRRRITRRRALALGGAAAIAPLGIQTLSTAAQDGTSGSGGGILPENRILLYYGFPGNDQMGILGEHEPEQALELLQAEAENYRAADPERPVKIGFEMIASVAQSWEGEDGKYIADASVEALDTYTQFTADNDMLLFLDVQMGFREPKEDYSGLEEWIAQPHVHLGIDPEFHMRGDELPGQDIGQVTGAEVTEAQQWLVDLAEEYDVPRKVLIVHQFHHSMIEDKDQVAPMNGVDLVIDMDGWGSPDLKRDTYYWVIHQEPIEYHGVKLFYQLDDPLMTAEEVLALDPSPDLIIYQ
jgi:hypothetical protein